MRWLHFNVLRIYSIYHQLRDYESLIYSVVYINIYPSLIITFKTDDKAILSAMLKGIIAPHY
jgi:hypothetical protein